MQGRKGWKAVEYFNPFPLLPRCGYTRVNSQPQYVALEHGTHGTPPRGKQEHWAGFSGLGCWKEVLNLTAQSQACDFPPVSGLRRSKRAQFFCSVRDGVYVHRHAWRRELVLEGTINLSLIKNYSATISWSKVKTCQKQIHYPPVLNCECRTSQFSTQETTY